MSTIQLTPEEIKMIEIQRQEKELAEQKKIAENEIKRAKAITEERNRILRDEKSYASLEEGAIKMFDELPKGEYKLLYHEDEKTYEAYDYTDKKEVYWFEEKIWKTVTIQHIASGISVRPHWYNTNPNRFSRHEVLELRFDIKDYNIERGDNLKVAKTIHKKISDRHERVQNQNKQAMEKKDGFEWLVEHLTYENHTIEGVKVEKKTQWRSSQSYGSRSRGYEETYVDVTYPSKFVLRYTYRKDGEGKLTAHITSRITENLSTEDLIKYFAK